MKVDFTHEDFEKLAKAITDNKILIDKSTCLNGTDKENCYHCEYFTECKLAKCAWCPVTEKCGINHHTNICTVKLKDYEKALSIVKLTNEIDDNFDESEVTETIILNGNITDYPKEILLPAICEYFGIEYENIKAISYNSYTDKTTIIHILD